MQFIPLARKVLSGDTTLSNNAIVLLFSKKYYFFVRELNYKFKRNTKYRKALMQ